MPNSRIPRTIDEFNTYITTTVGYMLAGSPTNNWTRLGWLQPEMTKWSGLLAQWTPLYLKYSDKKGSRTTAIKDTLLDIIEQTVTSDKSGRLLDRVAASPNVTIFDMETLHIKRGVLQDTTASRKQTAVSETVVSSLQPVGGGDIAIKCRTSHDSKNASIAEDADSVQYVYLVGDTAPAGASEKGLTKEISTKSSFTLKVGSENAKKNLYIYFRWYHTKYPDLAGSWSALQTVAIL